MTTKKLNDYTREELLDEVKRLKKRKTFGLVWENKEEQVAEDCKVKLPVLSEVTERAITADSTQPTHLIIEGDNYHSLSALNYTHAGQIDVIYIDPPYNTGNKDFIYNDRYVDREDSYRHSKWLSFMSKRLRLAHSLLNRDGAIFISIDNNEYANLKVLCDDIFGEKRFVGNLIWRKKEGGGQADAYFATEHEYILVYSKSDSFKWRDEIIPVGEAKYNKEDETGRYTAVKLAKWGNTARKEDRPKMHFPLVAPNGKKVYPVAPDGNAGRWRVGKKRMEMLVSNGLVEWKEKDGNWYAYEKIYYDESDVTAVKERSILYEIGTTADGTKELTSIFGKKDVFENPKPTSLISFCLTYGADKNATILDFFAGSGTTGHAVLKLNKDDGGNRTFIMGTNNENSIAENITYQRMKNVIDGYSNIEGIPANIRYFKTDFVDKQRSNDGTRAALVARCADMIRIRENCFDQIVDEKSHKFYANANKFVAVIFDPFSLGSIWKELEAANTSNLPVSLYVFSYSQYAYEDEIPETHLKYKSIPIPESILEVYQRIFRKQENGNV